MQGTAVRFSWWVDDQDWPLGPVGYVGGDTSGHPSTEPGVPMGPHDDEAGVMLVGGVDDCLPCRGSLDRQAS
jgi:hypothetical protein